MMSEKDNMLAGRLYNPFDPELIEAKDTAQDLLYQINQLHPQQKAQKADLVRRLFQTDRRDFNIELPFRCDYGFNINIGKAFYANYNCTLLDSAPIRIGDNVMFAPNVSLFTATHPIDPDYRRRGIFALPITIGDNVWIGGNSVVMPGVRIGNNAVIGAGSVVTKDIPDNCIAVGNPCKVLRQINQNDKRYYFKDRPFSDEFHRMMAEFLAAEQ
ncbi:sugar O-acetyltransferase [Pasteurellaceae bacterium USgator11]|nr:sugar O-acetyltransferase [Pasteurellaceae bacterium USgator41]TNG95862.1 sugar O-acetyltransferase [Pasteurellaceae bacterium UScroc12]TNG98970.1 sugar O-acetyltransferase [Pasteurellaceae bacterium UScroc31]TNG99719.1 sugar O-acetyltransferase [Pasteurellaceae bacterium USgator11]